MIFKTYTRYEAEEVMQKTSSQNLPHLDDVYEAIRKRLEILYQEIENEGIKDNYDVDVKYGLKLYDYLHSLHFNNRAASDTGFWRYLSVAVIPHIVEKRWERTAVDHYWKRPSRIWLSSIWWYVHLSWQGSIENTEKLLSSPSFTTDTILNLVERTGREGTNVKLYRRIMYYQSLVKKDSASVFRAVMKLNTATSLVIEPNLYPGGLDEYAKSLYKELNLDL